MNIIIGCLLILAIVIIVILGRDHYSPTDPRFISKDGTGCWDCKRYDYCAWGVDGKVCGMFEEGRRRK